MSNKDLGWAFKAEEDQYPKRITKSSKHRESKKSIRAAKRARRKKKKERIRFGGFYNSEAWLRLRHRVLKKWGGCCMLCGRSYRKHKVVIHVDHIIPRSKRPDLELQFENLQVLCEDCNVGKSNLDATDWRPEISLEDEQELEAVCEARKHI